MNEVSRDFNAQLVTKDSTSIPTSVTIVWDQTDPYAIRISTEGFEDRYIDREMFFFGGNNSLVKVFFTDVLCILFFSDSHAFVFEKEPLTEYAQEVHLMSPVGSESQLIDWDQELKNILPKEK